MLTLSLKQTCLLGVVFDIGLDLPCHFVTHIQPLLSSVQRELILDKRTAVIIGLLMFPILSLI